MSFWRRGTRAVDISPPPIPRSVWSVPPAGGLDSSWSKPAAASTNVTCGEDVPGHAGAGSSGSPAPRRGKLAILVPLWRADGDVALLVANLAALLDSQGFVNYHIHIIEQHPAASFKPGLLVDVGFSVAEETQGLKPTDTVVYQQPRVQPEPCVCYALPPHTPFMHLASAQSFMGYRTPYVGYCGGAWAMRVDLFRRVRGMATQYTGYEGLEDDLCRRVEQELQMGSLPALPLPWGRFDSQSDVEVVYRLAKLHRGQNQDLYRSRWQANRENPREVADAVAGTAADGMHALPEGWRERVAIREEGPHHTWWLLRLFPDQEALLASKEEFDGSGAAKDGAGDASVSGDGLSAPNDLSAQSVTDDAEDRLA